MKNFRLIILIIIQLLLLGLSFIIFSRIAGLGKILQLQNIDVEALQIIEGLIPLVALTLLIPFLGIMLSIFTELQRLNIRKVLINMPELQNKGRSLTDNAGESEDNQLESERISREKYDNLKQEIHKCIDSKVSTNGNLSHKLISEKVLSCIAKFYEISQGEIFIRQTANNDELLVFSASYAFYVPEHKIFEFKFGEGLIGQVAKAGKSLFLDDLPEGYITVKSGLGSASPTCLLICPWKDEQNNVFAVIELAAFKKFTTGDIEIIEDLSKKISGLFYHKA